MPEDTRGKSSISDNTFVVHHAAVAPLGVQVKSEEGFILHNVHSPAQCAGEPCVLHNPSDHHMREWKLNWRQDKGLMERLCPAHSVGHPDPDSLAWHKREGRSWMGVHGCCGCCATSSD